MTKKQQVDLDNYRKIPRLLTEHMEIELGPGGCLHPVLLAILADYRLRLDIRERRFNVYYGGGNLMCVDGRKSPWALSFDENYFKDGVLQKPDLPEQVSATSDAHARTWVEGFPHLIAGMDDWWKRHRQDERAHCQAIAGANSGMSSHPSGDYLVLDLEYQYAQRRFDMIAAKRRRTEDDASGWQEPDLVFVEFKSALGACSGKSGLGDHARDYQDIIMGRDRQHVNDIKQEYENVIAQKSRLGLLDISLGFRRFSLAVPELLVVFLDLDLNAPGLQAPLRDIVHIPKMKLNSKESYLMIAGTLL